MQITQDQQDSESINNNALYHRILEETLEQYINNTMTANGKDSIEIAKSIAAYQAIKNFSESLLMYSDTE